MEAMRVCECVSAKRGAKQSCRTARHWSRKSGLTAAVVPEWCLSCMVLLVPASRMVRVARTLRRGVRPMQPQYPYRRPECRRGVVHPCRRQVRAVGPASASGGCVLLPSPGSSAPCRTDSEKPVVLTWRTFRGLPQCGIVSPVDRLRQRVCDGYTQDKALPRADARAGWPRHRAAPLLEQHEQGALSEAALAATDPAELNVTVRFCASLQQLWRRSLNTRSGLKPVREHCACLAGRLPAAAKHVHLRGGAGGLRQDLGAARAVQRGG